MNRKTVRLILGLTVALSCLGNSAQETQPPTKKPTPSKADQEKAKADQEAKAKAKAREKQRQIKAKNDAELKAKAVDVNHASKAELMKALFLSDKFAESIIAHRPYKSKAELVTKHAIPESTYQEIHSLVVAK